jgi:hypothetical protein
MKSDRQFAAEIFLQVGTLLCEHAGNLVSEPAGVLTQSAKRRFILRFGSGRGSETDLPMTDRSRKTKEIRRALESSVHVGAVIRV